MFAVAFVAIAHIYEMPNVMPNSRLIIAVVVSDILHVIIAIMLPSLHHVVVGLTVITPT